MTTALAAAASAAVVLTGGGAASAATGTVTGSIFEDYNANGVRDGGSQSAASASATDRGVAGLTVAFTDSTGAALTPTSGSATTDASGNYSVTLSADTADVRVVFPTPAGFTEGPRGADSGTSVQFVALGGAPAVASYGITRVGDYSQDSPRLINAQQWGAINNDSSPPGQLVVQSTRASLVSSAYADRGLTAPTTEATADQTGSVWGTAQLDGTWAFTAALFKRHARTGPGGLGGVYLTELGGAPDATTWVSLPAGDNPRTYDTSATSGTIDEWFHDTPAYAAVGTIGLGGITLSLDQKSLLVINLDDKSLYEIPIAYDGASAPVAGTPIVHALPLDLPGADTGCASADLRPYGITASGGAVWITLTCTGPTQDDTRGYVYQLDQTTFAAASAPAYEAALGTYGRGYTYAPYTAQWHAWSDSWPANPSYTQPLLSDVAFDANGDMTIGIKDRFGDQSGYLAGNLTEGSSTTYEAFAGGDILRACLVGGAYVQESGGSCGSRTGSNASNSQGPGGGEYYFDDYGSSHQQTALGGVTQVPGYSQIVQTAFDPGDDYRSSGYRFLQNSDGAFANSTDHHVTVVRVNPSSDGTPGPQGSFSKAGGIGDLSFLASAAPLEIGNRVWFDRDGDGQQDAGEPGIPGVTVTLHDAAGTQVGSTTTDADGEYYFGGLANTGMSGGLPLEPETVYQVRVPNAVGAAQQAPLSTFRITAADAGDDVTDSDGYRADTGGAASPSGTESVADVTTGLPNENNHTLDFGFAPDPVRIGNYVWVDSDWDGLQDPGEPGIPDVSVTVSRVGGGTVLAADGTPYAALTVQTDTDGLYLFESLAPGQYVVTLSAATVPAGLVPTKAAIGANTAIDSSTGTATSAVLAGGQEDLTLDFGFVAPVSVGDFVWLDLDGDGVQDPSDTGINGAEVTISSADGVSQVLDITGTPLTPQQLTQTTANNGARDGAYLFAGLAPGQYRVTVDPATLDPQLHQTLPNADGVPGSGSDSSDGTELSAILLSGESDLTLDFGYVLPVSVGDYVWQDYNFDGLQDATDIPIAGATVTLTRTDGGTVYDVDGAPLAPLQRVATTGPDGGYLFGNLQPGQYRVTITAPSGFYATKVVSGLPGSDSSATPGYVDSSVLPAGSEDLTLDFGYVLPVSVGNYVWIDSNGNGRQDAGEPGIEGVTLTISNAVAGEPVHAIDGAELTGPDLIAVTDGNGLYQFSDLQPGRYVVTITAPTGYKATTANQGDTIGDSSTGSATSAQLPSGAEDQTLDFGFIAPVSVGDYVWEDLNWDGLQGDDEPAIAGVTLTISSAVSGGSVRDINGNVLTGAGALTRVTDENGFYEFTGLYPGQYIVTVTTPVGYVATKAGAGDDRTVDSSTGSATSAMLPSGDNDPTLDFGFVRPVSVGDYVWEDLDWDGIQEEGEPAIPGVTLTLTAADGASTVYDINGTPITGDDLQRTTDENGLYLFEGLAPGAYTVTVTPPTGYTATKANQGDDETVDSSTGAESTAFLPSDSSDPTLDFGFVLPVTVGDFVWEDLNYDGIQDEDDPGIEGVELSITDLEGNPVVHLSDGSPVEPVATGPDGEYEFADLPPGTYIVTLDPETAPDGFLPTVTGAGTPATDSSTGTETSATLPSGSSDPTLDFGFVRPAIVGDFVWIDLNRNGIQDAGEPGIEGVKLTLSGASGGPVLDADGNPVEPVLTTGTGAYLFGNLNPGVYVVTLDPATVPAGFVPTRTGQGDTATDSSTGTATSVFVPSNGADLTLDFGFVQPVVVGDFVWIDSNGNGVQDAGEPGIPNITLTITTAEGAPVVDLSGVPVGPTTTDGNGKYEFVNLPPGQYVVTIDLTTLPAGLQPTVTEQGGPDADSSNGSATSLVLTSGGRDLSLDFGFVEAKLAATGDPVIRNAQFGLVLLGLGLLLIVGALRRRRES